MEPDNNPARKDDIPAIQQIISVMWPSFLTAGFATVVFFTFFDPFEIGLCMGADAVNRIEAYSIGFFLFWMLTSSSCALTCYFQKPCTSFNPPRRDHES